jgi:hypothetical protein
MESEYYIAIISECYLKMSGSQVFFWVDESRTPSCLIKRRLKDSLTYPGALALAAQIIT